MSVQTVPKARPIPLHRKFDIFLLGLHGPVWMETADTREEALRRIDRLPPNDAGGYGILSHHNGDWITMTKRVAQ